MAIFCVYLVCFIFSISYSGLPFHLVYVFQFLHLFFFFLMFFLTLPSSTVEKLSYACNACSVAQSCPTLCDPVDCSPPGSSVHGILQARILEGVLEWVAISFSRAGSSRPRDQTPVSCIGRQILYH